MLKLTITPHKISNLIEELTLLWIGWMKHHNASNNPTMVMKDRRLNGAECEKLQRRRQEILEEINSEFSRLLR